MIFFCSFLLGLVWLHVLNTLCHLPKLMMITCTLLFLVPFPIFILVKCRGSLFRLLQRSGTKLDVRRRVHMALDIVSAFSLYYEPIVHMIQCIDQLVNASYFEQGTCQSPSK